MPKMKIFLDTADIKEIEELVITGLIDGVTTNPSLIAKSGRDIKEVTKEICALVPHGPVSAEVTAMDYTTMMKEADVLRKISDNIAIKVPLTFDGLRACKTLSDDNTMVNVTLCFTANQALLAAKAGATFISPFLGRLDDLGQDGTDLISDISDIYLNYPEFETEILAASIRSPKHVNDVALLGADVVTLPGKVLRAMYTHPLTDKGLEAIEKDWKSTGQSIL
jgi:transaldolase